MRVISPSQIAVQAANMTTRGLAKAQTHGRCAMCGTQHQAGADVVPFLPPETFMDYAAMRAPESKEMCVYCDAVWCRDFAQTYLKTIVCDEGVFPAASNDHLAYWLLNPPKGAWLFLQGDQKIQHVVFRAPVNHSQEVYQVRMGDAVLTVRREMLIAGAEAARELSDVATQLRRQTNKKAPALKSPFHSLSRDCDSQTQGQLRIELIKEAQTNQRVASLANTISKLTAGELWGLTSVLYAANPTKPEPKISKE